jgi:hypothetical protein
MAKKATAPVEQISEDIVEQELVIPSEETPVEEVAPPLLNGLKPEVSTTGFPSRDFHSPLS